MVYDTFTRFMADVVFPLREKNPEYKRLDGWESGGNFEIAGRFQHIGRTWVVHSDTHYEPLLIAYRATEQDGSDPFVLEDRKTGLALNLRPDLRSQKSTKFKHLYIYAAADK